jgi:hypothetical protein
MSKNSTIHHQLYNIKNKVIECSVNQGNLFMIYAKLCLENRIVVIKIIV